jgi:aminoglycoside 6'-N-acetyltransferase I
VEGTESSPVGYLEGVFVKEEYRKRGYAKELLCACEMWAKDMGCTEFASDCELDNTGSLKFHIAMGFVEANRIICFKKNI